ncbi:MAG: ribose-5-phosphate isomerase [Microbacterium sp.]|uniref:ribose-5-phosphate isomerase n=1 Tax=Microbacterium sp. TaxID=51671 RepID=UPI001D792663|nr:ribose-5-phosphate isomerase [Microbacterium sp.]MBW8762511.1 ribose-5-phosphate isomerase [Microbacterium sp.]
MNGWRVVVGADDAGYELKETLRKLLESDARVESVTDLGVDASGTTAYPHIAAEAAGHVADKSADRALLVCGTGLGMAITANKVEGVRAVTAHDAYSVERSVLSNDAQVLALGARVIGPELAKKLVDEWLDLRFDPGSASAAKVALIREIETGASK